MSDDVQQTIARLRAKVLLDNIKQRTDPYQPTEQQQAEDQAQHELAEAYERGDPPIVHPTAEVRWWYGDTGVGDDQQAGRIYFAQATDGRWVKFNQLDPALRDALLARINEQENP